jgi:hypothetical protein
MKILLMVLVLLINAGPAQAICIGPSNYSDCILSSMKNVTSDVAARAIELSCRKKFSDQTVRDAEIPRTALSRISGSSSFNEGHGYSSTFSGNLYNGNSEWIISQVTLELTFISKDKTASIPAQTLALNINNTIQPLEHISFCLTLKANELKFDSWSVVSARGSKIR